MWPASLPTTKKRERDAQSLVRQRKERARKRSLPGLEARSSKCTRFKRVRGFSQQVEKNPLTNQATSSKAWGMKPALFLSLLILAFFFFVLGWAPISVE